jgi:trans-aconitate methyltransferase
MTLREKFQAQPWFQALSHRQRTFVLMIDHYEKAAVSGLNQIIETGTARAEGNWSGDGQSTLIWDWVASQIPSTKVLSIDLNPAAVEVAKLQTKHVQYHAGDSVQHLTSQSAEIL